MLNPPVASVDAHPTDRPSLTRMATTTMAASPWPSSSTTLPDNEATSGTERSMVVADDADRAPCQPWTTIGGGVAHPHPVEPSARVDAPLVGPISVTASAATLLVSARPSPSPHPPPRLPDGMALTPCGACRPIPVRSMYARRHKPRATPPPNARAQPARGPTDRRERLRYPTLRSCVPPRGIESVHGARSGPAADSSASTSAPARIADPDARRRPDPHSRRSSRLDGAPLERPIARTARPGPVTAIGWTRRSIRPGHRPAVRGTDLESSLRDRGRTWSPPSGVVSGHHAVDNRVTQHAGRTEDSRW